MRRVGIALLATICVALQVHAGPKKVGEDVLKSYDTPHPYVAAEEGAADLVWTDVLTFAGAAYIAPHFSRFHLAEGDYLIVRSPDGSRSWKYEKLGKGDRGLSAEGFWAIHIAGDTAVIELHGKSGGEYGYTVDRFARGFSNEEMELASPEALCGADNSQEAKCLQPGEPAIYDKSRAVARILIQGSNLCTAWLVGDQGHVLTNGHCIENAAGAADTDFEFMAEGALCATNCQTQLGCPGTIEASTSTLVQINVNLDYTLVLLPSNITPTYGYLRLRNALPSLNERVYIPGHPQGFGKRIASASTDANDPSGFCEVDSLTESPCIGGAELQIGYACDTQPGNSGSPVIAYSDHKVVAIHDCSNNSAQCPFNRGQKMTAIITDMGPNLPHGAVFDPAGTVKLDQDSYACSDTIGIEVRDDNLVGNGTQSVSIASTNEPGGETVVLNETPASSGIFLGSINTTPAAAAADGLLSVANGNTITVTYVDADDGTGNPANRTDTAAVDCIAPVITNVQAINVTGNSADITWTTNENANSLVTYGLAASPPPTLTTPNAALVTSHSVHLTGLLPCRSYIFKVASTDGAGNSVEDSNGGTYYSFTTGANTNPTYASSSPPVTIPDLSTVNATINVTDINTVQDVNVKIKITHTYDGDLNISLVGPNGTVVPLATARGGSGDNYTDTVFDDSAATAISAGAAPFPGSFRPESPLSVLNGIPANGTWTLRVTDTANVDTGTIDKFEVTLSYPPQACGPFVRHNSHTVTDTCSGSGAGSNNGVVDPGEDLSIPVVLANTGTDVASNITATLTSPTPGVQILDGSATYGTLNPGQSGPGSDPFLVRISDSVPCGTLVTFNLAITATEGSWGDSFTVQVGAQSSSTTTYNSSDVPKVIADNATVESTLNVADTSTVIDVNVTLSITHTFDGDVDIFLVGPNGTQVELSTDNGSSGDNYTNTVFDDAAGTAITVGTVPYTGTFKPEGLLSALNGIPANGTWKLRVGDDATTDTGTLTAWSIQLTVQTGYTCNNCTPVVIPPPEVLVLTWSAKDTVGWSSATGATMYNLYKGLCSDMPNLQSASMDSCLEASTPSLSANVGVPESANCTYWYARGQNAGGEGPAGSGTGGPWISNSSGSCPP